MKNEIKVNKPVALLGGFIASFLIFNAFSKERQSLETMKIKKWIEWEIMFKEGTSEEEKNRALLAIESYILNLLGSFNFKIISIKFVNIWVPEENAVIIIVNINIANMVGTAAPSPRPNPPKMEIFEQISNAIADISEESQTEFV